MPDISEPVDQERCDDATDVTHGGTDKDTQIPEIQAADLVSSFYHRVLIPAPPPNKSSSNR